jgi:superfamily II DNA or RNA helicase
VFVKYLPPEFKKLEYQEQAVLNAKKIILEYGGVFISDVVGLGKTYISAMLAGQLDGRTLVIAPPVLLEKSNPGSWYNVFSDFKVPAAFESLGKLDDLLDRGVDKYTNVIIDEAHRFRTESNITFEKLAEICRGKRVILVTATPC